MVYGVAPRTAQIFELTCPYSNQYQGEMLRFLFVCSAGMLRSPTAANVATSLGYNARSCGSAEYALIPISVNLVHWADKIFFVEENNFHQSLEAFFGDNETQELLKKKAVVWEIEDNYNFNDPWLITRVKELLTL